MINFPTMRLFMLSAFLSFCALFMTTSMMESHPGIVYESNAFPAFMFKAYGALSLAIFNGFFWAILGIGLFAVKKAESRWLSQRDALYAIRIVVPLMMLLITGIDFFNNAVLYLSFL